MRQWFHANNDQDHGDVQADSVLKHLRQVIFKQDTFPVPEDAWPHSGPEQEKHDKLLFSLEDTALRVQATIERREQWLWDNWLPLDTVMNDDHRRDFLNVVKQEYRREARKGGERPGWCCELQRRCGSKELWELFSFSGRWDPNLLEEALSRADSPAPRSHKASAATVPPWRIAAAHAGWQGTDARTPPWRMR